MNRPWPSIGIGWLFAVVVALIAILVILGAIAGSTQILWICLLLLALALLV